MPSTLPSGAPRLVLGDDALDDLERMQQPQIERHAQARVRHDAVAREHRVLERPEVAQPHVEEVVEGGERLLSRHRDASRAV